jgi:hypothetical protein
MHVFLEFIASFQVQDATIRAAADDLGGAVACVSELIPIAKGFETLQHVSGVERNIPKFVLVLPRRSLYPCVYRSLQILACV